jgi:hypothetical protein
MSDIIVPIETTSSKIRQWEYRSGKQVLLFVYLFDA